MKIMKKSLISVFVCVAIVMSLYITSLLSACSFFSSCSDSKKRVNVSTIEEMMAVNNNEIAVLTNDIDCDFTAISQITSPYGVDGAGHTIKNLVLNGNSLFKCKELTDITIENVTYKAENISGAAIVIQDTATTNFPPEKSNYRFEIDNVHVKNSKMEVRADNKSTYVGVFAGNCFTPNNPGGVGIKINNSTVENVTINCYGSKNEWQSSLYVGGIVGYSKGIEMNKCSVDKCDIAVIANNTRECAVGGIIGYNYNYGTITNCRYTDSYLYIDAFNYTNLIGTVKDATKAYAGGIAGYFSTAGAIDGCFAQNANINASSIGEVNIGGIAGKVYGKSQDFIAHDFNTQVKESYVNECYVSTSYCDPKKAPHSIGGFVGMAGNVTFISSFVCNTEIELAMNNMNDYSNIAGFIGKSSSNIINYCATGVNEILLNNGNGQVETEIIDDFASSGTLSYCYITEPIVYGNSLNAEIITETSWYTPATIIDKLNLISIYWEFETGKLPYFVW